MLVAYKEVVSDSASTIELETNHGPHHLKRTWEALRKAGDAYSDG